ncbi:hypothetical protein SDC9_206445 [bioreactor metagenome]|uniref:Uncharacterized protein n=1 Tax=bioreactor metagenome TaxID=1076179 RepID=A0A645J6I6_9ZZZZ
MCKKISLQQEINPQAPILAAHHLHRLCYLFLGRGFNGRLLDDITFQIHREGSEGVSNGFEY